MKDPTKLILTSALIIAIIVIGFLLTSNKSLDNSPDPSFDTKEDVENNTLTGPRPEDHGAGTGPKSNINTSSSPIPTPSTKNTSSTLPPSVITNVLEVFSNPDNYLDQRIKLWGRVYVKTIKNPNPCNQDTGENCNPFTEMTMTMIDPEVGELFFPEKSLAIYQHTATIGGEPFYCTLTSNTAQDPVFNCGIYIPKSTINLLGIVKKNTNGLYLLLD